jgi:hypothetical protein
MIIVLLAALAAASLPVAMVYGTMVETVQILAALAAAFILGLFAGAEILHWSAEIAEPVEIGPAELLDVPTVVKQRVG